MIEVKSMEKRFDLGERMEDFTADVIKLFNDEPQTYAGRHLAENLIKSSTSATFKYGESLGAASINNRRNKLRSCLKNLRTSLRIMNIQTKSGLFEENQLADLKDENDQLIRIIVTRIKNLKDSKNQY